MNSKEALHYLYFLSAGDENKTIKCRQIIRKDLEILDILKRNIYVADNTIYATPNELNSDDYNKLKEWYDNGKTN